MAVDKLPEVWLRGPLQNIPALLQPVAHALLQAREELNELMANFNDKLLWNKVAGMASPGFHLQHLTGVLNRLFTYAMAQQLTAEQLNFLQAEGKAKAGLTSIELVARFNLQVDEALMQLAATNPTILAEVRLVGRAQVPSTVIGLYVHAAEHSTRHLGQLLVTVNFLKRAAAG